MWSKIRRPGILIWLLIGLLAIQLAPGGASPRALAAGRYYDDFQSYPVGSTPSGWTQYGNAPVRPTIVTDPVGTHMLDFPAYTSQQVTKWFIKDGYSWSSFSADVVLEFVTESDGAGLVVDWVDDRNFVAVLANPYWDEIVVWEFVNGQARATSTGRGAVPMETDMVYQLFVDTEGSAGGQKTLSIGWDNGYQYDPEVLRANVRDVGGRAGVGSYQYLSHVIFDDFNVVERTQSPPTPVPAPVPSPPANLRMAGNTQTSITLQWDDRSNNEDGFVIYRWNGSIFEIVGNTGANATTFTDSGRQCNTGYSYEVSAQNGAGKSSRVRLDNARTAACAAPPPSFSLAITDIQWAASPQAFKPSTLLVKVRAAGVSNGRAGYLLRLKIGQDLFSKPFEYWYSTDEAESLQFISPDRLAEGNFDLRISGLIIPSTYNGKITATLYSTADNNVQAQGEKSFTIPVGPESWRHCTSALINAVVAFLPIPDTVSGTVVRFAAKLTAKALKGQGRMTLCDQNSGCIVNELRSMISDMQSAQWETYVQVLANLTPFGKAYKIIKYAAENGADVVKCAQWIKDFGLQMAKDAVVGGLKDVGLITGSPVFPLVVNAAGQRTGFLPDGRIVEEIPGSAAFAVGDERFVLGAADGVQMQITGYAQGTMNVSTVFAGNGGVAASYSNVPVTQGMRATLDSSDQGRSLKVDANADGRVDQTVAPSSVETLGAPGGQPPVVAMAHSGFGRVWSRTDGPVAAGQVNRTWFWGPQPGPAAMEQYTDAPNGTGTRLVQYFDKSRMEMNNPNADPNSPFFVTNGLLTVELVGGYLQTGNTTFVGRYPANIPMAGDSTDSQAPTYASFQGVSNTGRGDHPAPDRRGQVVTSTINRVGQVGDDPSKSSVPGVRVAYYEPTTRHNIPEVFWQFLNASGAVNENGQVVNQRLIDPWFYASGLPISEAYWAKVKIGGVLKDVMVQAFERRVLTYVPTNQAGWQVEMGNIGAHYYDWRYKDAGKPPAGQKTMQVYADRDWQDTGVSLQAGESVTITYISGQWSPWPGGSYDARGCPDPVACGRDDDPSNVTTGRHAALIGRIGQNQVFVVGVGVTVRATQAGMLALRINDKVTSDDSGSLTVQMSK